MVEQVQEMAEYVFKGKDPWFESPGQLSQLKNSTKAPQLLSTNKATTSEQGQSDQLLQAMSTLVGEEVEKRLTTALMPILSHAPDLNTFPAPVTVHQSPVHPVTFPVDHLSTTASAPAPSHTEVHQLDDQQHQPDDQHYQPVIDPIGEPSWPQQGQGYLHSIQQKSLSPTFSRGLSPWMAFSHWSCDIPQHSQSPHPLAFLFAAYSSSSLSRPDQPTCQLVAPLPSISHPNVRATMPCVLKSCTLASLLNISANCTPSRPHHVPHMRQLGTFSMVFWTNSFRSLRRR